MNQESLRNVTQMRSLVTGPPPPSIGQISDEMCLYRDGTLEVFYSPLDHENVSAQVAIVGLTPGWQQTQIAFERFLQSRQSGRDVVAAAKEAKSSASFAGTMRTNLIRMLDELRLPAALELESTAELFGASGHLLHTTSALRYPVFKSGKNYSGSPRPIRHNFLKTMVEELLGPELERVGSALVIPLGKATSECIQFLSDHGRLSRSRCLDGFPHPSGANGHRASQFARNKNVLERKIAEWFSKT